jgi:hypothetical protein
MVWRAWYIAPAGYEELVYDYFDAHRQGLNEHSSVYKM